ncbi:MULTISPECIES: hypothetical protein [unclassified Mesorhizobium]|uniref:hypothetical protein n=1 Tax=unclassified Mesorhizobium TaxID=325217 RepID=UPI0011264873|nr:MULTISPECIES: hypothetical protein [unclassified Mesorhizobium]TPK93190.1 hypothetical protein FJ567_26890 [Mesorhizobium sp. B2-4-16]TPL73241.1 hypothetical protein FJ956_10410 [Mesorhizobium sp. B2-4-3]
MHHDDIMEGLLGKGVLPDVEAFGGIDRVLEQGAVYGASVYSDEFVALVLPYRDARRAEVDGFLVDVVSVVARGPELDAIADRLFALSFDDSLAGTKVFRQLLAIASERGRPVPLRNAALKGALALARNDARRLTRLEAELIDTEPQDDSTYITHVARIAGILSARSRNPALAQFLARMAEIQGAEDQVSFELGLMSLQRAIEASDTDTVIENLRIALSDFERAASLRESRYDARLFRNSIDLLLGFHERAIPTAFAERVANLEQDAFAYTEYSLAGRPNPILGAIASQIAALVSLSWNLVAIIEHAADDIWLDAINLIERHLLVAYEANRSVFAGTSAHGIDRIIRPEIETRVFGNRDHLKHLTVWFRRHAEKFDGDLTRDLKEAIERVYRGDGSFPPDAGSTHPLDPALLERVRATDEAASNQLLDEVAENRATLIKDHTSVSVIRMLERVDAGLSGVADYKSPRARIDFNALVFGLGTFLEHKLNSSVEQDKFSAYLFRHGDDLPVEKDLQQDFLRHGKSSGLPIQDEVKGVAGGRADIRYDNGRHRLTIEVKREFTDASFDRLLELYGEQTLMYQITNLKLGVMLVLDLSRHQVTTAHMDTWYETRVENLMKDAAEWGVLIVKVPGRRGTPSAATVAAKKSAKRLRAGKAT